MTNQQKPLKLDELISQSKIILAITSLRKMLNNYLKRNKNKDNRYFVYQEILETKQQLLSLENQLEDLIQKSKIWGISD